MAWEAVLQTSWRCDGGIPIDDLGIVHAESVLVEQLDRAGGCTLQLDASYYDRCKQRLVVMVTAEDGQWWEFRIDDLEGDRAAQTFALKMVPPWFDLERADVVRERVGSRLLTSFTETRTPAEFIAQRVLANRSVDRLGWLDAGVCSFTKPITLTWDWLDRAAFLNLLPAAIKRGELALRADDFNAYLIDFVEAVGADLPTIPVLFGERLRRQSETTKFGDLYTAVRVFGEAANAEAPPASGANNVWRVSSVTALGPGSTAPYAAALRDPADASVSPIQLDGVFAIDPTGAVPGCYLQLESGVCLAIQQSRAATGDVVVASAPSVGDLVSLVADAAGTPLDRIAYPAAVAAHGLVIASARVPGAREDRNYLANPGLLDGLTDWSVVSGATQTLIPRNLPASASGVVATGAPPGPAHFYVSGFAPGAQLVRGDRIHVAGAALVTSAASIGDATGDFSVPLTAALTDDIPDGTQLVCPTLPSVAFAADGSGNTIGATTIAIRAPGFITKPWLTDDEITVSMVDTPVRTIDSVVNPTSEFITFNLIGTFPYPREIGDFVEWRDSGGSTPILLEVTTYYPSFGTTIEVKHPFWDAFGGVMVPPFGTPGDTLRFGIPFVSVHTVVGTPTWGTNRRATVTITPGLPVDTLAGVATLSWARDGGAPVLGPLTLVTDAVASATSIEVQGDLHVSVLPSGSTLLVPAINSFLAASVTLDGSGAGAVQLFAPPGSPPLDGSAVTISRHTEWAEADGGGPSVMFAEGQIVLDDSAPTNAQASPRSRTMTILVPPGETREVVATVAATFWSQQTVASPAQYAYGKLALVNVDTNAVVAWGTLAPENAGSLTSPDNARLPLTFDAGTSRWLPLHVRLFCNVILSATTRLQLRFFAPSGITNTDRARGYFRWGVVHIPGMTDVTYFAGSLDNGIVLTAVELLARDSVPAETYALELADIDLAYARRLNLPDEVAAPVRLGSALALEDDGVTLRVISQQRTPVRKVSAVTVGRQLPSQTSTLAAVAVVTLGGAR